MTISSFHSLILDLLFPRRCVDCSKEGSWFCDNCSKKLIEATSISTIEGILLEKVISVFDYKESAVQELLQIFKYEGIRDVAGIMADLMKPFSVKGFLRDCVLIPVPTSNDRRKSRGYNQAEELALALGEAFGLPVWSSALVKKKSESQVGKSALQRKGRQQVFRWNGEKELAAYKDRAWIIVDDLRTTGSTLEGCAEVLSQYSVRPLRGLTFAHQR